MSGWQRINCEEALNRQEFKKDDERLIVPYMIGGKYKVEGVLSRGGFGVILIAKNTVLGNRKVLIKTIIYDLRSSFKRMYDSSREEKINKLRSNLVFECKNLINFRGCGESRMPSVIELVYDYSPQIYGPHIDAETGETFTIDELAYNEPYVVLQYIKGVNLGTYIEEGIESILAKKNYTRLLWERDVLIYIKDICMLMNNFHRRKELGDLTYYYIYQDLKPENIILSYDKFITLIDFGGLLLVGKQGDSDKFYSHYEGYGQAGTGTAGYMPPEMEHNPSELDERTDIYTIGATLYALLSGEKLTELDSRESWARIPYEKLKGIYSDETIEIIRTATQLDMNKRYQKIENSLDRSIGASLKKVNNKIINGEDKQ